MTPINKIECEGAARMDRTEGTNPPRPRRIAFWKLGLGAFLLIGQIHSLLFPDPNLPDALKASNPTERLGMDVVSIVLCVAGVWLLYSGIRSAWQKLPK
jgi:hypothetical protein